MSTRISPGEKKDENKNNELIEKAKVIVTHVYDGDKPPHPGFRERNLTLVVQISNGKYWIINISFFSTVNTVGGNVWVEVSTGQVQFSLVEEKPTLWNIFDRITIKNKDDLGSVPTEIILKLLLSTVEKDGYFQTALLFLLGQRGEKKNIYWELPTEIIRKGWDNTLDDYELIEIYKLYQRRQAQMEVLERDLTPYLDPLKSAILEYI